MAVLAQRQELQASQPANEVTRKNDADGNASILAKFRVDRSKQTSPPLVLETLTAYESDCKLPISVATYG
jgi:hypothetical protein